MEWLWGDVCPLAVPRSARGLKDIAARLDDLHAQLAEAAAASAAERLQLVVYMCVCVRASVCVSVSPSLSVSASLSLSRALSCEAPSDPCATTL